MTAKERAATARVLIDLIKADKVIDSREMALYRELKMKYSISRSDEVEAYSLSLSKAVAILAEMEDKVVADLMCIFEDMTMSDGFCAREEALLMLTLQYCLRRRDLECDVISTPIEESWFDENQVLYVESHHDKDINFAISSHYRAISRELKLCGWDFVYLPQVVQHYINTPKSLLNDVMAMLSPSLTETAIAGLLTKIKLFKTDSFCVEQLHHKLGFEEMIDTPPALLFRISHSKVDNKILTNFLRIELTPEVLEIVEGVVDTFLSFNGSDRTNVSLKRDEKGSFLYNGFYRQLFEILLLQRSVSCNILIDLVRGSISFPEIEVTLSRLHRKEKALYLLFVYEGYRNAIRDEEGNIRQTGGISFTPPPVASQLPKFNKRMELLQRKYARIYGAFGGEADAAPDITRSDIRNPMLTGIKKAINNEKEKIYNAERFIITRGRNGIYSLSANIEFFNCKDFTNPDTFSILESNLFKELEGME